MQPPRRFLPPIGVLQACEATARTGSVTAAARELNLTQSAVSRQIKALEDQLNVELFVRERQKMRLTLAGDAYAREIRDALRRISTASLNIRGNPLGGTLNLAVLPMFASRWLLPRLPAFLKAHTDITVNFETRLTPFEFRQETLDAAIHYGDTNWVGVEMALIFGENVAPICTPAVRARYGFKKAEDLREAPLLHLTSRPDAWEQWLAAHGAPDEDVHGMLFDELSLVTDAALAGLGIAMLPVFLVERELKAGALVLAYNSPIPDGGHYYLVWPPERRAYAPLVAFRTWLIAEAGGTQTSAVAKRQKSRAHSNRS